MRCKARTDIFGRCALTKGHSGRHVNSLGESFGAAALTQGEIQAALLWQGATRRMPAAAPPRQKEPP